MISLPSLTAELGTMMNDEIVALVRHHCTTMQIEFAELDALFNWLDGSVVSEGLGPVTALVHKLKGSTGTLGFETIARHAQSYEHALRSIGARHPAPDELSALRDLHNAMKVEVAAVSPEHSTLYQRFCDAL